MIDTRRCRRHNKTHSYRPATEKSPWQWKNGTTGKDWDEDHGLLDADQIAQCARADQAEPFLSLPAPCFVFTLTRILQLINFRLNRRNRK